MAEVLLLVGPTRPGQWLPAPAQTGTLSTVMRRCYNIGSMHELEKCTRRSNTYEFTTEQNTTAGMHQIRGTDIAIYPDTLKACNSGAVDTHLHERVVLHEKPEDVKS